jgi:hypothetical protein
MKYDMSLAGCQKPDGTDWTSCMDCNENRMSPICQELTHSKKRIYTTHQYALVGINFNHGGDSE